MPLASISARLTHYNSSDGQPTVDRCVRRVAVARTRDRGRADTRRSSQASRAGSAGRRASCGAAQAIAAAPGLDASCTNSRCAGLCAPRARAPPCSAGASPEAETTAETHHEAQASPCGETTRTASAASAVACGHRATSTNGKRSIVDRAGGGSATTDSGGKLPGPSTSGGTRSRQPGTPTGSSHRCKLERQ